MKSVLFIYRNQNLAKQFVKHFKLNGFDVYEFYDEEIPYFGFTFFQKLENIFHRVFFKDSQHIHEINERNFLNVTKRAFEKLKRQNKKFDYCYVIRGDLVPRYVLEYARTISDKMINYQLDGLSVSSKILDYADLFEKIYVFDKNDVEGYPGYDLELTTNCFFEDNDFQQKTIDFSYVGVNTEDRKNTLERLYEKLKAIHPDYQIDFYLKQDEFHKKESDTIHFLEEPLSYEHALEVSKKSKMLVDIKRKEHDGLSLRFFEAMNYKNKIITNNRSIINYDFYHPDNIYITDYVNFDGLEEFLNKPFNSLQPEIVDRYNFKNWINKILN